jgi:hypothetical protein
MRRLGRAALVALALATPAAARVDAQPAPYHRYRTLDTPHFHVHVAVGLEREGRVAAAAAERAYALLSRELAPPRGVIDLVVSDDADYSNGFATPFPSNHIVVFATPPVENRGLRLNEDWLGIVVTHELTHVFHLDRVAGLWGTAQLVFGRAPFLFPNLYGPSWLTEGLAVYYESRLTEGGRLKDSEHRILAHASAVEHQLPRLDQLSLGSPRFPGGEIAYAYGSLLIDYLAATRGDSTVGRFVERQSAQVFPFLLDRAAKQSFGISFTDAFAAWRDSLERTAGAPRAPLPGWRELTHEGYYVAGPRWRTDSSLVYVGSTGRETSAAYEITTSGARTRLGRRDASGPNVPLRDGGLLFAQLDFTAPSEVRSDLYRSTRDGRVTRLTRGARLIQPDVRDVDGAIVAVRLAAARSDLVLLDSAAHLVRVLRLASPDETWSEPRWSLDGTRIAAVRRVHGGEFSLEVIDVATGGAAVVDRGPFIISSPAWQGTRLLYVSERNGDPRLVGVEPADARGATADADVVYTPDVAPNGREVTAVSLRADGYHVGVALLSTAASSTSSTPAPLPPPARADTQQLAGGGYRAYSAWPSVLPRYWYPVIESAPGGGTRLGATTSGFDVLGRHAYSAYAAIPTSGRFAIAGLAYRYAGFVRPFVDLSVYQDWTSQGTLRTAAGTGVGTLLKRTQDASLALTWVRPRVRTYASFSAGLGAERRIYATDPSPLLVQLDTSFARTYDFPRAFVGATWSNLQRPALSISPEDGVAFGATFRERVRADAPRSTASSSLVATAAGYKSLDLPGFAHHVLALRLAGGITDRKAGTSLEVGGTSGSTVEVIPGYTVGEGRRTFGVRGFPGASLYGTQAATASVEYRAPLALAGRGFGLLPFFLDRSSLSAFADGGIAGCASTTLYAGICAPPPYIGRGIASVGGELGIAAALLDWDFPQNVRLGFAVPVAGRELTGASRASAYLAFGLSF